MVMIEVNDLFQHTEYYQELKQAVIKSDLLIDRLTLKVCIFESNVSSAAFNSHMHTQLKICKKYIQVQVLR